MALINTTTTGILGTTVYGDGQGALTVQKDGVTQGIYGNIPTFYAYRATSTQSISNATHTTVGFNTVKYDTCNGFDTTNYKWTPNVAGYYWIATAVDMAVGSGSMTVTSLDIRKNGTRFSTVGSTWISSGMTENAPAGGGLIYLNGTTDYVTVTAYIAGTSPVIYYGDNWVFFTGFLVKAA